MSDRWFALWMVSMWLVSFGATLFFNPVNYGWWAVLIVGILLVRYGIKQTLGAWKEHWALQRKG